MTRRRPFARQIQRVAARNEALQSDLWTLTRCYPSIDPKRLARALEKSVQTAERLDFRTRLLIRDSLAALESHWGLLQFTRWLRASPTHSRLEAIRQEDLGDAGFPSLKARIMDETDPQNAKMFLRELGGLLDQSVRLEVGGSMALILSGYLSRGTEDIDVVDEVPAEVRRVEPRVLEPLTKRYGLRLAHFQSHYLPNEWKNRLRYLDDYGHLRVYLVDVYDVFLSKLFSGREKDRDDLFVLARQLKKDAVRNRLCDYAVALSAEPLLRQYAARNWAILYEGESLPDCQGET